MSLKQHQEWAGALIHFFCGFLGREIFARKSFMGVNQFRDDVAVFFIVRWAAADDVELAVPSRMQMMGTVYVQCPNLASHVFEVRLMLRPMKVTVVWEGMDFRTDPDIGWSGVVDPYLLGAFLWKAPKE